MKRQKAKGRRQKVLAFFFCLLPFAFCLVLGLPQASAQADAPLVVLPFENPAQEPRLTWMREGAAILLTDELAALGMPVIEREERLQAFDRLQLPAHAALSRASTIRAGHALSATSVVTGTVQVQGDRLTVRARVVRIDTGRLLPEVEASGPLTEMFAVFATLAQKIRGTPAAAPVNPGPRDADLAARGGSDRLAPTPQVFELYVKGLVAETPSTALAFLEQALKAAPRFDRVRLALWDLLSEASEHQRALEVVSGIPEGSRLRREGRFRAALSQLHLKRFDESLQILRAMQSEQPAAPVANAIGVVELRRAEKVQPGRATYFFSQASELDPSDGNLFFNLGYAYWLDKDANAAIYWLREAVRRDPADGDAHFILSVALQLIGATAEAARERELAHRLSSKYKGWEAKSQAADPVPRGLERLNEELMPARARVESVISSENQRDQEKLAAFHLDAGRRAFDREADREAIQELRRALYVSPYLAEAHLLLGRLYLRGGRAADAVEELKIALWSEPSVPAHLALAEAFLQVQDAAAARAEVDRALALDPASREALALKARLGGPPW
jgi:predicted Zn-dependent protease/TolB-like protein